MLEYVSIGDTPKEKTLVVTPELFDDAAHLAERSWGVLFKLWGYPYVRNWILMRPTKGPPPDTKSFSLGRFTISIPTAQLCAFEGRVLGYGGCVPGFQILGFVHLGT